MDENLYFLDITEDDNGVVTVTGKEENGQRVRFYDCTFKAGVKLEYGKLIEEGAFKCKYIKYLPEVVFQKLVVPTRVPSAGTPRKASPAPIPPKNAYDYLLHWWQR